MKKKIIKKNVKVKEDVAVDTGTPTNYDVCSDCFTLPVIEPLTESFGNGDLNILRDKINEIIAKR
jgi:hypothetical protein